MYCTVEDLDAKGPKARVTAGGFKLEVKVAKLKKNRVIRNLKHAIIKTVLMIRQLYSMI